MTTTRGQVKSKKCCWTRASIVPALALGPRIDVGDLAASLRARFGLSNKVRLGRTLPLVAPFGLRQEKRQLSFELRRAEPDLPSPRETVRTAGLQKL